MIKNIKLHNLKSYIKHNPNNTVRDYAKYLRDLKRELHTLNKYILKAI